MVSLMSENKTQNKMIIGLYKAIKKKLEQEHVTPDNQVLIPVPKEYVDNKEQNTVEFIKKVGKLGRDNDIPIEVDIEPKRTKHQGKTYETVNFVIKFDLELDLEKLEKELNV